MLKHLHSSAIVFSLLLTFSFANAQHCDKISVPDNGACMKIRSGGGFAGAYALPCVQQGVYTEVAVPFQVFNYIAHGNGEDTVYQMRIDQVSNLPAGMCWASSKADNIFKKGEGGMLLFSGTTNDNAGQFNVSIMLSFDTKGNGEFDRTGLNYNSVSKTGRMILRLTSAGATCEPIDYDLTGNIAGSNANNTAEK